MNNFIRTLILAIISVASLIYGLHLGIFKHEAMYFIALGLVTLTLLINRLDFITKSIRIPVTIILLILVFVYATRFASGQNLIFLAIILVILAFILCLRIIFVQHKHDKEEKQKVKEAIKNENEKIDQLNNQINADKK